MFQRLYGPRISLTSVQVCCVSEKWGWLPSFADANMAHPRRLDRHQRQRIKLSRYTFWCICQTLSDSSRAFNETKTWASMRAISWKLWDKVQRHALQSNKSYVYPDTKLDRTSQHAQFLSSWSSENCGITGTFQQRRCCEPTKPDQAKARVRRTRAKESKNE